MGLDLINSEDDLKKLEQIMRKYLEIKNQDASSRMQSEVSSIYYQNQLDLVNDSELIYKKGSSKGVGMFSNDRDLHQLNT